MWSLTLCKSIVETVHQLGLSFMEARNCNGETPLFLAALSGNKEAFIFLHEVCQENNLNYYDLCCRSNDDDTILHVAIATKRFDLALEIIPLYPKLVHFVNKKGFSPLHVLASEPSAFGSVLFICGTIDGLVKSFRGIQSMIRGNDEPAYKVLNELVGRIAAPYEPADRGMGPNKITIISEVAEDPKQKTPIIESTTTGTGEGSMARSATPAILIAAKNGITKMVEKILEIFPESVYEVDSNMKNIVLLSVEHKRYGVYQLLLQKKKKNIIHDRTFWEVDNQRNTALHLAAKVGSSNHWPVPGAALQMNWEIKWFEYVKASMPESFRFIRNKAGETPEEVFTESHKKLVEDGGKWLTDICKIACPVASGVFVAAAFSLSPNVDVKELHASTSRDLFSKNLLISSISMIAVLLFISVITFSRSERSFRTGAGTSTLSLLLLGLAACCISATYSLTCLIGYLTLDIRDPESCELSLQCMVLTVGTGCLPGLTMAPYLSMLVAFITSFKFVFF